MKSLLFPVLTRTRPPRFSIPARLVVLLLVTYPINVELAASIRPVDIAIALTFLYALFTATLRWDIVPTVALIMVFLLASAGWGVVIVREPIHRAFGIGLLIKYVELLLLIWALASFRISPPELQRLVRIMFLVYAAIVAYILLRMTLATVGLIQIRRLRPDFPFTQVERGQTTAGHLMGMYLTTGVVFTLAYRLQFGRSAVLTFLLAALGIAAVILTGSRTPFIAIAGTAFVASLTHRVRLGRLHPQVIALFGLVLVGIAAVVGLLRDSPLLDTGQLAELVDRATNFDFANDRSAGNRITKSLAGLDNLWESGIVIGPGPFRFGGWFDNGVVRIVHDLGLLGFVFVCIVLYRIAEVALASRSKYGRVAFLGLVCFAIGNVATEFFLVARASVPFVVAMFVLIRCARTRGTSYPSRGLAPWAPPGEGAVRAT